MMKKIFVMLVLLSIKLYVFGQYTLIVEGSSGEQKTPYAPYKLDYPIYKYSFEVQLEFNENFYFGPKIQLLKHEFSVGGAAVNTHRGDKKIEKGNLRSLLKMKTYDIGIFAGASKFGFYIEPSFTMGISSARTDWKYNYTDYKDIDVYQNFNDSYQDIYTMAFSIKTGYGYTFLKKIFLSVFWEYIYYQGKVRELNERNVKYHPAERFSPPAFGPDPVLINPNCSLIGIKLGYVF